jgi:hypothetical protein
MNEETKTPSDVLHDDRARVQVPPHLRSVDLQILDALLRIEELLQVQKYEYVKTPKADFGLGLGRILEDFPDAKPEPKTAPAKGRKGFTRL